VEQELAAARRALDVVRAELRRAADASHSHLQSELLRAHASIAEDPALRAEIEGVIRSGRTAPRAVVDVAERFSARLATAASSYIRDRAVDVMDVSGQILEALGVSTTQELPCTRADITRPVV